MIDALIRWSLHNKLIVMSLAAILLAWGGWQAVRLPIDVLPDLTAPTVTILVEGGGIAPEEMESLVTFPIEAALNGAAGVRRVRSVTAVGAALVWVEFDWGEDIYRARQTVTEKLGLVGASLPDTVEPPVLAPISSIMGQIMLIGMFSQPNDETRLFPIDAAHASVLNERDCSVALRAEFTERDIYLPDDPEIRVEEFGQRWSLSDATTNRWFTIVRAGSRLEVHRTTSPMQQRTIADWVVRQQLLTIPGVSQVFVMGGGSGRRNPSGRLDHGGQWRSATTWPLPETRFTPYYLHADGLLSPDAPAESDASLTYQYDPSHPVRGMHARVPH